MSIKGINTKLIHGNIREHQPEQIHYSLKTPVYDSAAFEFASAQQCADAFQGKVAMHQYSRASNPTIAELEKRLAYISGAVGAVCVSSGMAAIADTILAICSHGDNLITSKYLFGNTLGFFNNTLPRLGIEVRYVDFNEPEEVKQNIDDRTQMFFVEAISNPHLFIFDIETLSEIASEHNVIFAFDNTLTTPYLFSSTDYNIDIEILSNTKAISGGATGIGGTILCYESTKWLKHPNFREASEKFGQMGFIKKLKSTVYRDTGTCLSPHNAYLQLLGLETLTLRIDKACSNAHELALFLDNHPKVVRSYYPLLLNDENNNRAVKYFGGKGGSIVTFEIESQEACFAFIDKLEIIRRATNLCDNKSLIIHPASTIYSEFNESQQKEMLINDRMVRLSAGIEDIDDLIQELGRALG